MTVGRLLSSDDASIALGALQAIHRGSALSSWGPAAIVQMLQNFASGDEPQRSLALEILRRKKAG